jgi:reactive intermediate/imine deaminase
MAIERYGMMPDGPGGRALPFASAVRAGDFLFVSGQVPIGPDGEVVEGGIATQARQTIENVRKILAEQGLGLADVVKATVWLADSRDFWPFNKIWVEFFGAAPPARSCVRADMMVDCKVEIEVVAYAPSGRSAG